MDTVDLYSARSRAFLIKCLCELFGEEAPTIRDDVERLMELSEGHGKPKEKDQDEERAPMSQKEKKQALTFLKNPNMFDETRKDELMAVVKSAIAKNLDLEYGSLT